MMIIIWILIGFAVYYLIKDSGSKENERNKNDAVEILKLRYVNGEIDEETYRRTLKVLKD